jgi:glycosyl transferase family 25
MWHSYLINLDKNQARLENSRRQFEKEKIPFTRIEAVNGWEMNDADIAAVYDADAAAHRYKYPLIKPEIGCYLSHMDAWRRIANGKEGGGFIFEDDFKIIASLHPVLEALSSSPENWGIAKMFSIKKHPRIMHCKPLTNYNDLVVPFQVPTCLLAYAIRKETAQMLVDTSIPFFRPVDEDHKFFWEKNLRVSLVHPSPVAVGDQQTQTGTIGGARRKDARKSPLFRRLSYQLKYKASLYYHRITGNSR